MNQNYFKPHPCYDSNYSGFDQPLQYSIDHQLQSILEDLNHQRMNDVHNIWIKLRNELLNTVRSLYEMKLQREEHATQISTPYLKCHVFYDDDDAEYRSRGPSHNGDEDISTISKKESDEFIKSSVEDLVPIPSGFEDTSRSDSECILPSCDDFTSSDDESLSDEDVSEDNVKIYSNPLFEFDDEYIFSDVNPLFDKVLEDIECKDSYDPNLDESTFLVTPLSNSNEDEYFTLGDDVELLLHRYPPTPIMSIVSILEEFTNKPPLEENDDLFDLESKEND
nr:hypothetical protein [Tanacetum cinerariifolium]